jgi:Transglycosylase SLT domain
VLLQEEETVVDNASEKEARLEQEDFPFRDHSVGAKSPKPHSSYLGFDPYAELPLDKKPAEIVLDSLRNIPVGTPVEEIKRAADAFGLDFSFMEAVAKIESDFDPKQRTGSYIGLFQLSRSEFRKYGSGDITSPRDNAVAAAYKLVTEATFFELYTHKEPTVGDLYLIHQQGWQGAAEHVSHPERIAWKSMCATDEGRQKGERWCKRAIWGNTLPTVKHASKSVNKLTSDAFVNMWRQRVDQLYSRYSETTMAANEDR